MNACLSYLFSCYLFVCFCVFGLNTVILHQNLFSLLLYLPASSISPISPSLFLPCIHSLPFCFLPFPVPLSHLPSSLPSSFPPSLSSLFPPYLPPSLPFLPPPSPPSLPSSPSLPSLPPFPPSSLPPPQGDVIVITRKVDANWFEGYTADRTGLFPSSYVTVADGMQYIIEGLAEGGTVETHLSGQ